MSAKLTLPQVSVGIITALPKERAAVMAVFPFSTVKTGKTGTVYDLCSVPCVDGEIVVALTQLLITGNNLAAAQTSNLINDCDGLSWIIMVGIAGAIPCPDDPDLHVRLGDIVVSGAQGVFQFDLGKMVAGGFEHRAFANRPSPDILAAVSRAKTLNGLARHK